MPYVIDPFIQKWLLGLLPTFGFCELCYYEHGCTHICTIPAFNSFCLYPEVGNAESYGNSGITWENLDTDF